MTSYSGRVNIGVRRKIPRIPASGSRRERQFVGDEGVAHRAALLSVKTWQSGEGGTKRQRAQLTSSNDLLCPSPVDCPRVRSRCDLRSLDAVWIYDRETKHLSGTSPPHSLAIRLCHSSMLCKACFGACIRAEPSRRKQNRLRTVFTVRAVEATNGLGRMAGLRSEALCYASLRW